MKSFYRLFILVLIHSTLQTIAQQTPNTGFSVGFHLGQYQDDFNVGLNFTSPYFAGDYMAVRLRTNLMYHQHIDGLSTTWSPYANLSLGLIGVGGVIAERIRIYGEGGVVTIFPSSEFSNESFELGGYGLFGFEFFMSEFMNYFLEVGAVGTGARADRLAFNPIYSNGLLISSGFRIVF